MDVQLDELIEKIKKDGVDSAEKKTAEIIKSAEEKAKSIVENARKEAEDVLQKAKKDSESFSLSAETALKQASRDLVLALQTRLQTLFSELTKEKVNETYGDILQQAILKVVESLSGNNQDLKILLSEDQYRKLQSGLSSELTTKLKSGIVIKPVSGLDSGFKIEEKDGSAYYDFTAASIAEIISEYLNADLSKIVIASVKE